MPVKSFYLEALQTFSEPVSVRQVHEKARQMFGDQVSDDRTSCRQCLDRHALKGNVEKVSSGRYLISMHYVDPIKELVTKNRMLEAECERLRQRVAELEATA